MRINDKHLTAFAASNSPIDKEGYLLKRGEVNKAYQKRWFVLKGNLLFYYEKKGDREPIGAIILEGCTVELAEMSDAYTFELVFQGAGSRVYILSCETQEDMESWMKAITCAGYEYMKLMVAELQRQLDELQLAPNAVHRHTSNTITKGLQQNSLIDFTRDSQSAGRQARANPFDNNAETQDLFGAVPFNPSLLPGNQRARNFEEMHKEFGLYIQQKSQPTKTDPLQEAPLLDLS